MAKDKMNHRRKKKQVREQIPLDISKFNDIIKKPERPKYDKKNYKGIKKYPPKNANGNRNTDKEKYSHSNKPNKPHKSSAAKQQQSNHKPNKKEQ